MNTDVKWILIISKQSLAISFLMPAFISALFQSFFLVLFFPPFFLVSYLLYMSSFRSFVLSFRRFVVSFLCLSFLSFCSFLFLSVVLHVVLSVAVSVLVALLLFYVLYVFLSFGLCFARDLSPLLGSRSYPIPDFQRMSSAV